jgi:hypothetical protein
VLAAAMGSNTNCESCLADLACLGSALVSVTAHLRLSCRFRG